MTDAAKPLTRLQRFRRGYARIDYYPHQDSVAVIQRMRSQYPSASVRQLIDLLIEKGAAALPETPGTLTIDTVVAEVAIGHAQRNPSSAATDMNGLSTLPKTDKTWGNEPKN